MVSGLTQVQTFTTWGWRIGKEGWDYIWPAPVVSRNAPLQKKQQRLVRGHRLTMQTGTGTVRAEPRRVAETAGWAQSPQEEQQGLPLLLALPGGCGRSLRQWDLSELHWCAFRSCALLISRFMCCWSGSMSVPVGRQFPVHSYPSCICLARSERGGTAVWKRQSDFLDPCRSLPFLWHELEHLEVSSKMCSVSHNGPCTVRFSMAHLQRPCAVFSRARRSIQNGLFWLLLPPFYSLRAVRTAYERLSASRSQVLPQEWLRSLLNELAGRGDWKVWCV